jgi:YVTN family beta-propeller protein
MMLKALAFACLAPAALLAQSYTVIVLHPGAKAIDEIDPANGKILHTLKAEDEVHEGVMTPDRKIVFATLPGPGKVIIVDAATLTQKGEIVSDLFQAPMHSQGREGKPTTSAGPHALAINNEGTKLYVGLSYRNSPGLVVYDVKAGKVLTKVPVPVNGEFMAVQPGTDKLYIPNRQGLLVVDTKTNKVVANLAIPNAPTGAAFGKNGEVWLSENGDGSVTVVDGKKDVVVKTIQTGGKGNSRIDVSPDGKWAAAAHDGSDDVAIIDTASREVVATVPVGVGYNLPIFSPDSKKLFVATGGGPCSQACPGHVVVLDVAEKKVIASYPVADDAFAMIVRKN